MLCWGVLDLMLRTLIADLDALDGRLRARQAADDPEVLAEGARVVRGAAAALGTSQTRLATLLSVSSDKTVRDWCSARMAPPRTALRALRLMLERMVDPPPEDLLLTPNRVGPCAEAIGLHLDELARRAEAAGWSGREVAGAVKAWAAEQGAR